MNGGFRRAILLLMYKNLRLIVGWSFEGTEFYVRNNNLKDIFNIKMNIYFCNQEVNIYAIYNTQLNHILKVYADNLNIKF